MLDTFVSLVTLLLALSAAAERLVELAKGFFRGLDGPLPDADQERKRQLAIHAMSVVASAVVVWLLQDYIVSAMQWKQPLGWDRGAAFALLASGGSSLWNSILTWLLSVKNLKQQKLAERRRATRTDIARALPLHMPKL